MMHIETLGSLGAQASSPPTADRRGLGDRGSQDGFLPHTIVRNPTSSRRHVWTGVVPP